MIATTRRESASDYIVGRRSLLAQSEMEAGCCLEMSGFYSLVRLVGQRSCSSRDIRNHFLLSLFVNILNTPSSNQ